MGFSKGWSIARVTRRHSYVSIAGACVVGLTLAASSIGRAPDRATERTPRNAGPRSYAAKYQRSTVVPFPEDNKYTAAREALGKSLFFDPRLSGSNGISCSSCHNPGLAWGDGRPRAIGAGRTPLGRRTPTILNIAWSESMFWDGRAGSLEEQALGPIQAIGEMNLNLDRMVVKIAAIPGYRELFARGYPDEPIAKSTVAKAIATFERQIVSGPAPFDRWAAGDDAAISPEAVRGFELFNTKGRCSICHTGWRFTDDGFHDIGVPGVDPGRGAILPGVEAMQHAFKTPTLRSVAGRAPYMHDGSVAGLEDVVELYDRGGLARRPSLSPELTRLHLTSDEKQALVVFLRTLTSVDGPVAIPVLPR